MILRELALYDSLSLYIQSELAKTIEEIDVILCKKDAIKLEEAAMFRKWEEIKRDNQKFCDCTDRITSPDFIKRIEDPARKKELKELARRWKIMRESYILKTSS
jgi:hypothetical protein